MKIEVNGESQTIDSESTITKLLEANGVTVPNMVSVQLNGAILANEEFENKAVKDGDVVEFLYFVGGGAK